jgi:hypothetical protein
MKNKPVVSCDIDAGNIKEAAAEIRRKYLDHLGFEIKPTN